MPFPRRQFVSRLFAPLALLTLAAPGTALQATEPVSPSGQRLLVHVAGLRSDHGNVIVSLFHGGNGFPEDDTKALVSRVVPIPRDATALDIPFDGLSAGDYAVSLFHDENTNGKLDERWGIPTEGFGVSNNPRLHWGAPNYKEAHFPIPTNAPETTITISLRYLRHSGKR